MYLRATHRVDSADLSADPIFEIAGQKPLFVKASPSASHWEIPESRMNFFRPASFVAQKPANLRRVFVLGGSTVQGRPYETETAFPKWLELRLRAADPSRSYEVVNCGGVSYASYRIAILLDEVLSHSPDAIVIYTGHNEFLEERSYDTISRDQHPLLSVIGQSHLVRRFRSRLRPTPTERQPLSPELRTRLDLVDGMKRYVRDENWRRGVVEHFRMTLGRIIGRCRQAEVPLILCVPTSDVVRTPPIKVLPKPMGDEIRAKFENHWSIARDFQASETERRNACQACLEIDPRHAGAHYIAGMIHWNRMETTEARVHLFAARDDDVCPLRATTAIIDQVIDAARGLDTEPVRCDQLFDQTDSLMRPFPDGIPDPQRFVDHIHPTIAGHQEIAKVIADRLTEVFRIEPVPSADDDYQASALEHLSTLDETYFARGKQRLEGLRNWAAGRAGKLSVEMQ
jgi:lysophospholipase L1-like esterase